MSGPPFSGLRRLLVVVLLVGGIAVSWILFNAIRGRDADRTNLEFQRHAAYWNSNLQREIDSLLEALHGVRALYASSMLVEREEFRRFVGGSLERHPAIESLQWVPRIPAVERERFERIGRMELGPDFAIREVPRGGVPVPMASRPFLYPAWYVEPAESQRFFYGLDHGSHRGRRVAMDLASEREAAVATAWEKLPTPEERPWDAFAVSVFLPVETLAPDGSVRDGYALAVFRIARLFSESAHDSRGRPVDLFLFDPNDRASDPSVLSVTASGGSRPSQPRILAALPDPATQPALWKGTLNVANREWTLICRPSPAFLASQRKWPAYGVLLAGLLLTGALVLHQVRAGRRAERIERKVQERTKELAAARRFLDSIVENIPNMLFVKDAEELRFVRFNRAGEEMLGYPREAMIGKNDTDFFPPEEAAAFQAADRAVLATGELRDIPHEPIETKSGRRILHTKKIPINDESGRPLYLLGISEDITELHAAQKALAEQAEELARSNAELEQFAYVASHDLQEPLRMVTSYSELLKRRCGDQLDAEALGFLEFAVDGAQRMRVLLEDLLEYSRVGTDCEPFQVVDTGKVLKAVLENLDVAVRESGAIVMHDRLPLVYGDETQLVRLFQNLISNAIKFHSEERPEIQVTASPRDGMLEFSVRDNGIGIPPEASERIFTIFQRLHTREEYPGTGLGLALSKRIVERHGGEISVESSPGGGAVFKFTLLPGGDGG